MLTISGPIASIHAARQRESREGFFIRHDAAKIWNSKSEQGGMKEEVRAVWLDGRGDEWMETEGLH